MLQQLTLPTTTMGKCVGYEIQGLFNFVLNSNISHLKRNQRAIEYNLSELGNSTNFCFKSPRGRNINSLKYSQQRNIKTTLTERRLLR